MRAGRAATGWVDPRGRRRNPVPRPVRRGAKAAVRGYAIATSNRRPLPDYLVIGAKRAGTTSMSRYLLEHPQVLPLFPSADRFPMVDDMKGVRYFDNHYDRDGAWYRSWFPTEHRRRTVASTCTRALTGEATPYYLFHPLAAERASATVPDARIVVMLRDPVERAFSHWKEQSRNGVERLSFTAAVDVENERLEGEEARLVHEPEYRSFAHEHQSYVAQGDYGRALDRWFRHYPRERVLVVVSEDFYARPQPVFDEVCDFLGIARHRLAHTGAWNAAQAAAGMPGTTRERLREHYAPLRGRLEHQLERSLPWPC
jgi:hypothetical protein